MESLLVGPAVLSFLEHSPGQRTLDREELPSTNVYRREAFPSKNDLSTSKVKCLQETGLEERKDHELGLITK